jgi:rhamnose transport system permease protein
MNSAASRVLGVLRSREMGILLAFLLVVVLGTVKNPSFVFSKDGWHDLLITPSILLVVAVGEAIVIITRNVDLSVGSMLGLTAYLAGTIFVKYPSIPWQLVFLIGLAFGGFLGLINGALVGYGKVPAMVITLGTLYAYRGINVAWTGSNRINADQIPQGLQAVGNNSILGIPILTIIALVILLVAAWYMRNMRSGREMYAIGSDPDAAELYGLAKRRRVITAFVVSGAMSGLAGVLYTARYATINSQAGYGFELDAIGAAVIGGVAIVGGSGTVVGAAIGAFLLYTINRALPVIGIPDFWQKAVVGALILGAIVLDRVLAVRQSRKLRETKVETTTETKEVAA